MNRLFRIYRWWWVICFLPTFCFSQEDTMETFLEQKLENLAELTQNEEDDYTNLLEALNYYKSHPINLNHATKFELLELGLLDEIQIENILEHLEKNGKLISVYELQSIDGLDVLTIQKILPYVKVADISDYPHITPKEMLAKGNHVFFLRVQQILEEQKGFSEIDSAEICASPDSRYIGGPQKLYARYRFTYSNNVSAGITAEKDAGELFFKNNQRFQYRCYDSLLNGKQKTGFDFYSAHFFLKNFRFVKALAIGDYQASFGQGLTVQSGLAYGKTFDAVSIKQNPVGLRPYTSVDENRFLRGGAVTLGSNSIQFTGFYSQKKIDANISETDTVYAEEIIAISSLQESGLHSTAGEIADKDAITQYDYGGNFSFRKRKFSLGLTGIHTSFSSELNRNLSTYNQFEFTGKELNNFGMDYSFVYQNFSFFGEAATNATATKETAFLNGFIAALDPKLSVAVLHRHYPRGYQSLSANAFAEGSKPANEDGVYFGINIKPTPVITINTYYDRFVFPWLRYQTDAPSYGTEFLAQLNYTPNKKFDAYFRFRQKDKFVNSNVPDAIDFIVPFRQMNFRLHTGYQISASVKLRSRAEFLVLDDHSKTEKENGFMLYQDVIYKKLGSKISFALRYALFDTPGYDSRIYVFETDIPGSYSIPSYYYKGSRTYLMVNYDITKWVEIWVRWSQTYYADRSIISSDLTEIQGHTKSEVKIQMKVKL